MSDHKTGIIGLHVGGGGKVYLFSFCHDGSKLFVNDPHKAKRFSEARAQQLLDAFDPSWLDGNVWFLESAP